jgi:glycosyltransferase involved in cell wall biosynthesis
MTEQPWSSPVEGNGSIRLSIGVIARNEEEAIGPMLESIFRQSLFAELDRRHCLCEIVCVANGCTDRTVEVAQNLFERQLREHPFRHTFRCRVEALPRPGKIHSWNQFVHRLSVREAEYLFLADGDIVVHNPATLQGMFEALESNTAVSVSTDEPLKDIAFKKKKTLRERISLATSRMTQSRPAQLSGQLYCIRAAVARNIYLPRDLVACEDGFIKALVCTFFLTRPEVASRVVRAPGASHIFQAYIGLLEIVRNQKRQMIGQTIVHILVDGHLTTLRIEEKLNMAETLRDKDRFDPNWLRELTRAHMERTRHFWEIFPDALSFRFSRLDGIKGLRKLIHLPAAILGFLITVLSCWLAYRFLKQGFQSYWPDTRSPRLQEFKSEEGKSVCEMTTQ